jgi:hypothetical protein
MFYDLDLDGAQLNHQIGDQPSCSDLFLCGSDGSDLLL